MPWEELGTFELITNKWIFSGEIEGEIFRVSHIPINRLPNDSLRAVIAQGFVDEEGIPNKFNPKIFAYGEESEVFTFPFPVGLSNHSLIFKRLDKNAVEWKIKAEVFFAENPLQDYENYLIARFGSATITQFNQSLISNMALYPLLYSGSVTPTSNKIKLESNKPVKLRSENTGRTQIRIRTSGHAVLLATGFNESGSPLVVLEECPPNYLYVDQASSAGMYQGEIWAVSEHETHVSYTEYSAQ